MKEVFSKLNPEDKLFSSLLEQKPVWWQNIVNNKRLYIEIRKDNYIDVYYNGGAILNLDYSDGFRGKIHYKYISLVSQDDYVDFKFLDNRIELDTSNIGFSKLADFSASEIRAFQERIGKYFSPSSEKGIQADFILKNSAFLDSEFQYQNHQGDIRFDLTWVDVKTRKIFIIELKKSSDSRLYFNENSRKNQDYNKIDSQIQRYRDFIRDHNRDLLCHYFKVHTVKKKLGILSEELRDLNLLRDFQVEERPILLIGDCTQVWIDKNKERLNKALQNIAYGCFYQGSNTRRFHIPETTTRNRYLWP